VGDISEPVKTQRGYHLIQVTDEKLGEDGKRAEVQVSHLLLKLRPSQETIENLRDRFYAFFDVAETEGLDAAANEFGFEVKESEPFQDGLNVPGIPNSLAGSAFAFSHDPGTLSPVFESNDRFYVTEVAQRLPAGHRPLDEVRSLVENALQRERRAEQASERLATAWQKVVDGSSLEEAADAAGLTYAVTDTFTLRQNIPDIGFATPFAEAALELNVDETASDVRTQRGVYGLKLVFKSPFDEADFQSKRAQIGASLLFNRQRQVLQEWLAELENKAVIEDRRAELL
jgi:parvulin-like peptidyl-prolyl isomerase